MSITLPRAKGTLIVTPEEMTRRPMAAASLPFSGLARATKRWNSFNLELLLFEPVVICLTKTRDGFLLEPPHRCQTAPDGALSALLTPPLTHMAQAGPLQDDHVVNIADTRIHPEHCTQNMQNRIVANCQKAMSRLNILSGSKNYHLHNTFSVMFSINSSGLIQNKWRTHV